MKWIRYGRNAVLIRFADKPGDWAFHKCRAIVLELEHRAPSRMVEFVPGYTSVLVEFKFQHESELPQIANDLVRQLERSARSKISLGPLKEIPVRYDGPDLERVARHNNLTPEQVVKYHTAPVYKVYLLGFSPGFPYLGDLHYKLRTPRLNSPRNKVPAGSVAIGGEHTGIYPVESPGGWNIIGHTEIVIFNPAEFDESAFYLKQGDQVKFVSI